MEHSWYQGETPKIQRIYTSTMQPWILLPVADEGVEGWMAAPHFSYKMVSGNKPSGSELTHIPRHMQGAFPGRTWSFASSWAWIDISLKKYCKITNVYIYIYIILSLVIQAVLALWFVLTTDIFTQYLHISISHRHWNKIDKLWRYFLFSKWAKGKPLFIYCQ